LNAQATIGAALGSVAGQTYPNIETIVVDSESTDQTLSIARRHGARILSTTSERAGAKNLGASSAQGEYLLFIDADMVLEATVVQECVDLCKTDRRIAAVVIPERSVGRSFWVKVRDFERSFYAGTDVESARFFRRELVERVHGFDQSVVLFEESTLPQRIEKLGLETRARTKSNILHYEYDFRLAYWLSKKYYYGRTMRHYATRYSYARRQINPHQRSRLFLRRSSQFAGSPVLALGVIILKTLELSAIYFGDIRARYGRMNVC
jgi:glycosyltransferase involved in cell wall biosynthesis